MTSYYTVQASPTRQAKGMGHAHNAKRAWGTIRISDSAATAANNAYYMVKLPKGAIVTGGRVYGDPLDSSGSGSALASIHVGLSGTFTDAEGTAYTSASATACFVSSLALGPDAAVVATSKATNLRSYPFGNLLVTKGPLVVNDESYVIVTFTASCLAMADSGALKVDVEYYASVDS